MRHITYCYMSTSRINSSPRFKTTAVRFRGLRSATSAEGSKKMCSWSHGISLVEERAVRYTKEAVHRRLSRSFRYSRPRPDHHDGLPAPERGINQFPNHRWRDRYG